MATQIEEIVVDADLSQTQDLSERGTQRPLKSRGRRPVRRGSRVVRGRQRACGPASRCRSTGNRSTTTTADGTMYSGSSVAVCRRNTPGSCAICSGSRPGPGTTYPTSRLSPGMSSRTSDRGPRDARIAGQHRLDLADLDPEPPDLHLVIGPADELEGPVGTPASQIPGPVHPLAGRTERTGHEPLRGQPGPARDSRAPDLDPPRTTRRSPRGRPAAGRSSSTNTRMLNVGSPRIGRGVDRGCGERSGRPCTRWARRS